jgi:hypothetical protein
MSQFVWNIERWDMGHSGTFGFPKNVPAEKPVIEPSQKEQMSQNVPVW